MKRAAVSAAVAIAVAIGLSSSASASHYSTPSIVVFAADRAPTVTGEIYRVDPNGRRVDLSKSPWEDFDSTVSSDGKRVAFVSTRGGRIRVLEVGIDGRGLVAVTPNPRRLQFVDTLYWQPGGKALAILSDNTISIVRRGHRPITFYNVVSDSTLDLPSPWSPDGNVLLLRQGQHGLRGVSPDGRTLWTQANHRLGDWVSEAAWGSLGLFAIADDRGVAVYEESGRLRFRYRIPVPSPDALAWSPDGSALATTYQVSGYPDRDRYMLQVRAASGGLLLQRQVADSSSIGWAGDSTVVVYRPGKCGCHAIGIDVNTGTLRAASVRWFDTLSADRQLAIAVRGNAVGAAPTAGGPIMTYRKLPSCNGYGGTFGSGQFAGRSIVYESDCYPSQNLYSVGRRIHRVTKDPTVEQQPALSPDGTQIAYVRSSFSGSARRSARLHFDRPPCSGSDGIRIVDAATGAPIRTLTHPKKCMYDGSPSWSPDGQTILYSRYLYATNVSELFTIPADGGPPSDLNLQGINPAWGPSKIAYQEQSHSSGGIWTANPDGSNPTKVASKGTNPTWSSTGTLAYLVGASTVVVGGTPIHLPFAEVYSLAWSRDGARFVVVASKTKAELGDSYLQDVYTVKTNGTSVRRLTKYYDASSASAG